MSPRKPSSSEVVKVAETLAVAAVGVGSAVLFVVNPKFRRAVTDALGVPESKLPSSPSQKKTPYTPRTSSGTPVAGGEGVVYLLKAGPFFKIGKAQDFNKRLRQIKLQLPYPVETVHLISCADISHVESYWHRRFATRRQNGEWFVLTDEEVAEFKANRQM